MCSSYFGAEMENYQGDLTDILRATGGSFTQSSADSTIQSSWEILPDPITNLSTTSASDDMLRTNIFGDPFCNMRDPLLHELNVAGSTYFSPACTTSIDEAGSSNNNNRSNNNFSGGTGAHSSSSNFLGHHQESSSSSTPCNIFSRIQISSSNINQLKLPVSPCDSPVMAVNSPRGFNNSAMVSSDIINVNSSNGCLIDNTRTVQISSPRNLGIKRRKSQAKKVVCIPAPASANNRPTGEVVPSDLWAWRKYGQKPIKGSPYPRGYYRCSSSKGCSARKQVERSRTDPNMLVITYTSEHNHPWPTQRNALAGSTRSQPTKNNNSTKTSSPGSSQKTPTSSVANNAKEEQKESSNDTFSPNVGGSSSGAVKEELEDMEKQMEMDDGADDLISTDHHQGIPQSYRPAMPLDCGQSSSDDFFADLGEIEADPEFDLLCQGFIGGSDHNKEGKTNDPFSIFDWSSSTSDHHHNANSFGGQEAAKRGL